MTKKAADDKKLSKVTKVTTDLCKNDIYVARNLSKLRKKAGVSRAAKGAARAIYKYTLHMGFLRDVIEAAGVHTEKDAKRTVKLPHLLAALNNLGHTEYVSMVEQMATVKRKPKPDTKTNGKPDSKSDAKPSKKPVPEDNSDSDSDDSM